MDKRFDMGYPGVPFSITNKTVDKNSIEDRSNPFSLLEFIRRVGDLVDSSQITSYYNFYITEWNKLATNKESDINKLMVEAYTSFIQDISLNFNSEAENKFFSQIDYTDPYDLDVALSFIGKKIKEIALYYSKKREAIKLESTRVKLKGSNKGLITSIKERILDVLANNLDNTKYSSIVDTSKTLDVYVDELYQNTAEALNRTPDTLIYDAKDRDYGLDIFLRTNQSVVSQIFTGVSNEYQAVNEVSDTFTNKKELTRKYMGADYFYVSATEIQLDTPDIIVNSKYKITYNKQQVINKLIDVTPPPPCRCIDVQGPSTFTFTKCGDLKQTLVTVPPGELYTACGFGISSQTLTRSIKLGKGCRTKDDCITLPPGGDGGGDGGDGGDGGEPPLPPSSTQLVYYCNETLGKCFKAKRNDSLFTTFYLTLEDCQRNCTKGGGGGGGGGTNPPGGGGGGTNPPVVDPPPPPTTWPPINPNDPFRPPSRPGGGGVANNQTRCLCVTAVGPISEIPASPCDPDAKGVLFKTAGPGDCTLVCPPVREVKMQGIVSVDKGFALVWCRTETSTSIIPTTANINFNPLTCSGKILTGNQCDDSADCFVCPPSPPSGPLRPAGECECACLSAFGPLSITCCPCVSGDKASLFNWKTQTLIDDNVSCELEETGICDRKVIDIGQDEVLVYCSCIPFKVVSGTGPSPEDLKLIGQLQPKECVENEECFPPWDEEDPPPPLTGDDGDDPKKPKKPNPPPLPRGGGGKGGVLQKPKPDPFKLTDCLCLTAVGPMVITEFVECIDGVGSTIIDLESKVVEQEGIKPLTNNGTPQRVTVEKGKVFLLCGSILDYTNFNGRVGRILRGGACQDSPDCLPIVEEPCKEKPICPPGQQLVLLGINSQGCPDWECVTPPPSGGPDPLTGGPDDPVDPITDDGICDCNDVKISQSPSSQVSISEPQTATHTLKSGVKKTCTLGTSITFEFVITVGNDCFRGENAARVINATLSPQGSNVVINSSQAKFDDNGNLLPLNVENNSIIVEDVVSKKYISVTYNATCEEFTRLKNQGYLDYSLTVNADGGTGDILTCDRVLRIPIPQSTSTSPCCTTKPQDDDDTPCPDCDSTPDTPDEDDPPDSPSGEDCVFCPPGTVYQYQKGKISPGKTIPNTPPLTYTSVSITPLPVTITPSLCSVPPDLYITPLPVTITPSLCSVPPDLYINV